MPDDDSCCKKIHQDQCAKLNTANAPQRAFNLSSSCTNLDKEEEDLEIQLAEPAPVLVFCTPERLCVASFARRLQAWHKLRPFAYIVVDEAHLVAEQVGIQYL